MSSLFSPLWVELGLAYALCLAVSALGFRRVDYFISIGYGFSIAAQAALFPLFHLGSLDPFLVAADGLLFLYGMRLGVFLLMRERQPSFERERAASLSRSAGLRAALKPVIWLSVAALYAAMYSPVLVTLSTAGENPSRLFVSLGVAVMIAGLVLESIADAQKSAFKARHPARFCDAGLFRLVRSPNYFGEMVFWLGAWISGLGHYQRPLDWIFSLIGLVCIQLVMLGSARRLELKQSGRYAGDPAYIAYTSRVPILFPLVPLYSLMRLRVYLG